MILRKSLRTTMKKTYMRPESDFIGVSVKTAVMVISGGYEKFEEGQAIGTDED